MSEELTNAADAAIDLISRLLSDATGAKFVNLNEGRVSILSPKHTVVICESDLGERISIYIVDSRSLNDKPPKITTAIIDKRATSDDLNRIVADVADLITSIQITE